MDGSLYNPVMSMLLAFLSDTGVGNYTFPRIQVRLIRLVLGLCRSRPPCRAPPRLPATLLLPSRLAERHLLLLLALHHDGVTASKYRQGCGRMVTRGLRPTCRSTPTSPAASSAASPRAAASRLTPISASRFDRPSLTVLDLVKPAKK